MDYDPLMMDSALVRTSILVILSAAAFQASVSAATTIYTDPASFFAVVTSLGTETFESLPDPVTPVTTPYSFNVGGISVSAASLGGVYSVGSLADKWLSTASPTTAMTVNFSGDSVYAVGGFFFGNNITGLFMAGDVMVATNDLTSYEVVNATTTSFVGFISSDPITSLSVTAEQPEGSSLFPTLNDMVFGAPSAVPEPGTAMVHGLVGAAGLGMAMRRKRR